MIMQYSIMFCYMKSRIMRGTVVPASSTSIIGPNKYLTDYLFFQIYIWASICILISFTVVSTNITDANNLKEMLK